MNKFKLYHPLIMACFYFSLLLFFWYIDLVMRNPNLAIVKLFGFDVDLFMGIIIIGFVGYSAFLIIYSYFFQKNTKGKLAAFSLKPPEINEEDEGTKFIYATATKNIYIYYTTVIPSLILVAFVLHMISFELKTNMLVYVLLFILVIHYLIYYVSIAKLIKK
ncbi:hypothetical protein [Lentibacillus saliphilus]|uniref:hypothetical protein n=1 Tax=Lentibacillus saliphilus TaxID=2737028 RepID=UPI001C2F442B|nr:hypothetical protein [Lentibacillus saliphilus]